MANLNQVKETLVVMPFADGEGSIVLQLQEDAFLERMLLLSDTGSAQGLFLALCSGFGEYVVPGIQTEASCIKGKHFIFYAVSLAQGAV